MAKQTSDTITWFGNRFNSRQMKLAIPAGPAGDDPGLLFLESNSSAKAKAGLYLWADSTGTLRYSATAPTNEDGDGTTVGSATNAVTSSAVITDHVLVRGDGGAKGVQKTGITVADTNNNMSGVGTLGCGAITTSGTTFTFSGANPSIIGGDDDGVLTITGDTASNQGGILKLYGNNHGTLAGDISFYTDTTQVLEYDVSETNWDFLSKNVKGVGTLATADITVDSKLVLSAGSITDGDGAIDFGDENLSTSGTLGAGATTVTSITDGTATLSSGSISGGVNIALAGYLGMADDQQIRLGADGALDAYIQYDSTNNQLEFFDRNQASTVTLSQLVSGTPLNPIVSGDLTISDGQFDWTNSSGASDVNTWDFANVTANVIDMTPDHLTTHHVLDINADAITSGTFLHLDTANDTSFTGEFLECISDGSTVDLAIKRCGEIEILGADATDMITITKGNIVLTDGKITTGADSDIGSKIARNITGASSALLELENTHTGDTGNALHIDHKGTGAATAINLDSAATDATAGIIDMDLAITSGVGLHMTMGTATTSGGGIYVTDNSNDTTARALIEAFQANTTGSHGAIGVKVHQDGTGDGIFIDKDHTGNALQIDADVTSAGNIWGIYVDADNAGAGDATGIEILGVSSGSGTAYSLKTGAGNIVFNEGGSADADVRMEGDNKADLFMLDAGQDNIGINCTAAATTRFEITVDDDEGLTGLTIDQDDVTQNKNGIDIENAGTGDGIFIDQNGNGIALSIDSEATSGNLIDLEPTTLTTGWVISADDANALTTGGIANLVSNSAQTDARVLVQVTNDNAAATSAVPVAIQQDSTTTALFVDMNEDVAAATPTTGAISIDVDSNDAVNAGSGLYVNTANSGGGPAHAIYVAAGTSTFKDHIDLDADSKNLTIGAGGELVISNAGTTSAFTITGNMSVGDGGSTNYTQFAANTGAITFVGTARPTRSFWIAGVDMAVHSGGPATVTAVGDGVGMAFAKDADESMGGAFRLPYDYAAGTNLTMYMYYCANDTNAAHKSYWEFDTKPLAEDELCSAAGDTDTFNDTLCSATAYDLNITSGVTIDGSGWAAGDTILYNLLRDADNGSDDLDADAIVFGLYFEYTADTV